MTDPDASGRTTQGQGAEPPPARTVGRRIAWLAACVGAGALVGLVGRHLSGDVAWFAAIPAAMAIGWLVVANPDECEPSRRRLPGG